MTAESPTALRAPTLEDCRIVELRDYLLHPGQRDTLITLFEREFVETQEAEGMRVIGQFTDLDRPDHFVWLRGFADKAARRAGLESFYGGGVWAKHREAANATMIDASDVRLLCYARPTWSLVTPAHARPSRGTRRRVALDRVPARHLHPARAGRRRLAARLRARCAAAPGGVRCDALRRARDRGDGERLSAAAGAQRRERVRLALAPCQRRRGDKSGEHLARSARWSEIVLPRLLAASAAPMEQMRLRPTPRSLLR
jgi:hypothetical protein